MGVAAGIGAAGLLSGIGGAFLGGNAASATKKKLNDIANMPGVSIPAAYSDSINGSLGALPGAEDLSSKENAFNSAEQNSALEAAIPGYGKLQSTRIGNTQSLLEGAIPEDVKGVIQRTAAAHAIGGGFLGSQAGHNLTARDLGRTSLDLQQLGEGNAEKIVAGTPRPKLETLDDILNIDPQDTLGIRSKERSESIGAYTNAATAPGATATWANYLQKQGSQLQGVGGGLLGG